ncbi:hypothetical protein B0H17DRAFT_688761 [Mycena rosella]|uniref:Uncharacterized protein n=1 Tax=Mycena rosella TaxID=1033263 RepID=A0AAD7DBH5_MYCRO|nr:hypothetical protein B0H17DRAFT_688761 [Mycena rosella]
MLETTRRFLNTVVKTKPAFTIPPSDPDPIHHFSTRNRRSANNFTSHGSKTSVNSWGTPQKRYLPSLDPVGTSTPRKPATKDRPCCCSCHRPEPASPAVHTSLANREPGSCSRSIKRTRIEKQPSGHRREPASHEYPHIKSTAVPSAPTQRGVWRPISVSEMGELPLRTTPVNEPMKFGTYSRMKASFKSWSSPRPPAARLKKPTRPQSEIQKFTVRSEDAGSRRTFRTPRSGLGHPATKDAGPPFMPGEKKVYGRGSNDTHIVSVNRFGWPLSASRNSGKGSCSTDSVLARPEAGAVNDYKPPPPRSRTSFELDLSPIIEDIHSFPSLDNTASSSCGSSSLGAERHDHSRSGDREQEHQDQEYQDLDSRNFDHMNLSGRSCSSRPRVVI